MQPHLRDNEESMRILIVEDEKVSRTKMETIMERWGACRSVETGRQALHHFEKAAGTDSPFQLVTLDIELPDLAGTEVLQRIRRIESDISVSRRAGRPPRDIAPPGRPAEARRSRNDRDLGGAPVRLSPAEDEGHRRGRR